LKIRKFALWAANPWADIRTVGDYPPAPKKDIAWQALSIPYWTPQTLYDPYVPEIGRCRNIITCGGFSKQNPTINTSSTKYKHVPVQVVAMIRQTLNG
jgi:hypothetical protein